MFRLLACLTISVVIALPATASERIALVIGIADYQTITPLKNTVNDARAIGDTLASVGFTVTTLLNPEGDAINEALDRFEFDAELAELALIYFAGHGVQVQGENFLIPADAAVASNADIQAQSISLKRVLGAVDKARKMRMVILDSCRNDPFDDVIRLAGEAEAAAEGGTQTRGTGGLAKPSPDRGTLVAFAARDGQVASDGAGSNSPFALALTNTLAKPNLEISLMFRQVRDQVLQSTGNQQEPYTYGSLPGIPFYLTGGPVPDSAKPEALRVAWTEMRPEDEAQFREMAAEGDARALMALAYRKLNPLDPSFDPREAVGFLSQAAELGSAEAQYELARQFEAGRGIARSDARALELYQQAADQDYADALNDLGFFYFDGSFGLPRDVGLALAHFERAAEQRHPQALYNYAALIDDEVVPGKTSQDAARYLYLALRSGNKEVLDILKNNPATLKRETWRALQEILQRYEFYTGVLDGDYGPGTARGLRRASGLDES